MNYFPSRGVYLPTVGRQDASSWAELDQIHSIWEGPSFLSDQAPQVGSSGLPVGYPGFELASRTKTVIPGGILHFDLQYVGLFSGLTIGPVATDDSVSEQELEYQQFFVTPSISLFGAPPNQTASTVYIVGTAGAVIRYESANVIFRYVVRGKPAGPIFESMATPTIISTFTRGSSRGATQEVSERPIINTVSGLVNTGPQIYAAGAGSQNSVAQFIGNGPWGLSGPMKYLQQFTSRSISPSWYRCQETWSIRYLPGTTFTI